MEGTGSRVLDIVIVHAAIVGIQFIARRVATMGTMGSFGMYLCLMPAGFNVLGWSVPALELSASVVMGLFLVLRDFPKTELLLRSR